MGRQNELLAVFSLCYKSPNGFTNYFSAFYEFSSTFPLLQQVKRNIAIVNGLFPKQTTTTTASETTFLTILHWTLCKTRYPMEHRFFYPKVMFCKKYNVILLFLTSSGLAFRHPWGEILPDVPLGIFVLYSRQSV